MKKWLLPLSALVILVAIAGRDRIPLRAPQDEAARVAPADSALSRAIDQRQSGVRVTSDGVVIKVLADDNEGSRHQRFLIRLDSGQTLLIAHNIDIAPRVRALEVGERIEFSGVYEWNSKGGVIHWTHHDPAGRRPGGWIRSRGQLFQ